MIYISRNRTDENGRTIAPNKQWFKKAEIATKNAKADSENHEFDAGIYAADIVRAALEELFHDKCAYCEHPLPETDWNVEHFRPKGRVAENKNHPGYYWLAYDWANLYPSCVPCNQRRKDKPRWGDLTYGVTGGKADQFPLVDGNTQVTTPNGNISKEKKLLLDPCSDDPERHLTYLVNGEIVGRDQYGEVTIQICNLTRKRLRDRRRGKVLSVIVFLEMIRELKAKNNHLLAQKLQDTLTKNSCSFAGLTREIFSRPEQFGI